MTRFRVWLALTLIRLARWVSPSERGAGKIINKFTTHILTSA